MQLAEEPSNRDAYLKSFPSTLMRTVQQRKNVDIIRLYASLGHMFHFICQVCLSARYVPHSPSLRVLNFPSLSTLEISRETACRLITRLTTSWWCNNIIVGAHHLVRLFFAGTKISSRDLDLGLCT